MTLDKPNLLLVYEKRLHSFFKRTTTFNIRWKKTVHKDFIAAAVFKDEFLAEFSPKELKRLCKYEIVAEKRIRMPDGSMRACICFIAYEMPQVVGHKKAIERAKKFDWSFWIRQIALFIGLLALLLCAIYRRAAAFNSAPPVMPNIKLSRNLPGDAPYGYFDDTELGNRCYWIGGYHPNYPLTLSCVHVPQALK